ncbi:MAG: putative flavoprotein [Microbacterium sp.]|nr:putative flavoprotein [Microbacterium sp.]
MPLNDQRSVKVYPSHVTAPTPPRLSLGVIVGSLRATSVTRLIADNLVAATPDGVDARFLDISDLPLYNEDLDIEVAAEAPAPWTRFREEVRATDAILFVTPEYNRSVPAPLKNAIDVGSAPHDQNVFAGLPAAIVSASPGRMGAFGANHHLRQSLVFLDMPTMQQP